MYNNLHIKHVKGMFQHLCTIQTKRIMKISILEIQFWKYDENELHI